MGESVNRTGVKWIPPLQLYFVFPCGEDEYIKSKVLGLYNLIKISKIINTMTKFNNGDIND